MQMWPILAKKLGNFQQTDSFAMEMNNTQVFITAVKQNSSRLPPQILTSQ